MLEFDAGGIGRELPFGFGVMDIAISLPSGDLVDEDLLVRDAAVETDQRTISIAWPLVNGQNILHRRYECAACLRRDDPLPREMRLELIFFKTRPMVLSLA
jgi:hypothetical protein